MPAPTGEELNSVAGRGGRSQRCPDLVVGSWGVRVSAVVRSELNVAERAASEKGRPT